MSDCHCGRSASKVHCPSCGRTSRIYCYAPSKRLDTVTRGDGSVAALSVFRCQACGSIFNDDDWRLRCNAPAVMSATTFIGKLTDAAKQQETSRIINEQFGGDRSAYIKSLFNRDKPLRPIVGRDAVDKEPQP